MKFAAPGCSQMFRVVATATALLVCSLVVQVSSAHAQGLAGFASPGELAAPHAHLEGITQCTKCHAPSYGVDEVRCMNCHDSIRREVQTGVGFHKDNGRNCESCHQDHQGRGHDLVQLEQDNFDHDQTGFSLRGRHRKARCLDCHESDSWTGLDKSCRTCHEDPHGASASSRSFLSRCADCHDSDGWRALPLPPLVFNHNKKEFSDYPLTGKHEDVRCAECHFDFKFVPVAHEMCKDCHGDPHRTPMGKECEGCHKSPKTWAVPGFNHDITPFPLEGQHEEIACAKCHKGGHATDRVKYSDCSDCHGEIHEGQFDPTRCDACHTVEVAGFKMTSFDHATTDFPLVGDHDKVECGQCHGDGQGALYSGLPYQDCDACHEDQHDGKFEPTSCQTCHTPAGWLEQSFDHDNTRFPRTGKHKEVECEECHTEFQWTGIGFDSCNDCHYEKNPHLPEIKADRCESCHDTNSFTLITFAHLQETGFNLDPQHTENTCISCHEQVDTFSSMDSSCTGCHQEDRPFGHYEGQCIDCHQTNHWFPGGLGENSHGVTGFPLKGAHKILPCEGCHAPGKPRGAAAPLCISCHSSDDPHRHQLGTMCSDCHTESTWFRNRFRHISTGWPLKGAHQVAECVDCHALGYIGTPNNCSRCHEAQAPPIPEHQSAVFPYCDNCHNSYSWFASRRAP